MFAFQNSLTGVGQLGTSKSTADLCSLLRHRAVGEHRSHIICTSVIVLVMNSV